MIGENYASWMMLLRTAASLAFVLGVIFLLAYLVKKYWKPERWAAAGRGSIRILQTFALEPKKKLMIVEVDGDRLLLGVSEASISCLKTLSPASSVRDLDWKTIEEGSGQNARPSLQ